MCIKTQRRRILGENAAPPPEMEVYMKAVVNKDGCISCGLCVSTCPEVFAFGDDGLAEANGKLTDSNFASAESARNSCPVSVIDIVED